MRAGVVRVLLEDPREEVGGLLEAGELVEGAGLLGLHVEVVREGRGRPPRSASSATRASPEGEPGLPLGERQARRQLLVVAPAGQAGALDGEVERPLGVPVVEGGERLVEQASAVRCVAMPRPQCAAGGSSAAAM